MNNFTRNCVQLHHIGLFSVNNVLSDGISRKEALKAKFCSGVDIFIEMITGLCAYVRTRANKEVETSYWIITLWEQSCIFTLMALL